jgi:hypothetical protein
LAKFSSSGSDENYSESANGQTNSNDADNEIVEIFGIQHLDFIADDGKPVLGVKIHCLGDAQGVIGKKCITAFFRPNVVLPADLAVGDRVLIFYNSRKKPISLKRM